MEGLQTASQTQGAETPNSQHKNSKVTALAETWTGRLIFGIRTSIAVGAPAEKEANGEAEVGRAQPVEARSGAKVLPGQR